MLSDSANLMQCIPGSGGRHRKSPVSECETSGTGIVTVSLDRV